MFDAEKITKSIPAETFKEVFIVRVGRDALFSQLRCGGEERLKTTDWKKIKEMFHELGVEEEMDKREMIQLAYALTKRAVIWKN